MKHGRTTSDPPPKAYRTEDDSVPADHVFVVSSWVRPTVSRVSIVRAHHVEPHDGASYRIQREAGATFHVLVFMVLRCPSHVRGTRERTGSRAYHHEAPEREGEAP